MAALRGTVEVHNGWPGSDQWTAMARWRQEPAGAVLVGRRLPRDEIRFDVVVCAHSAGEWEVVGSGGSSTSSVSTAFEKDEGIRWFFSQDVLFPGEDDEDAYVTTLVGFDSDDRLVLRGFVRPDIDEELSFEVS